MPRVAQGQVDRGSQRLDVRDLVSTPKTNSRYMSAYLSAFFSLPIQRQSGVKLTHEQVVNQLDNETVSYEVGLGVSHCFTDTFRASIKVETALYEGAVAWLKDLIYGAEFEQER